MYCEKQEYNDEQLNEFIMEFDGDIVKPTDTADSLDLDGDEIFDVRKSKKPIMQMLSENKKKYDFDDDILCV
jgi:hypothetical protein